MFIKALYVSDLHSYIDKTISQLEQIHTQVKNIQKSIEGIIALEDAFKGKTANSIRTFYQEVHMPFLLFLEGFITNYSDTLQEMKKSVQDMEPNKDGVIREDFLSQDVQRSFERMEQITMALTDEANAVLHSVKDIINVPNIDDGEFLDNVQHAKKMNRQTIEKLQAFDRHNTAKLEPIHQDIRMMKNYISQIRELGNNGKIRIGSYQARQLDDQKFHKELVAGIENKAVRNAIGLEAVLGEAGKLLLSRYIRFAAIPIRYLQKHFGLKTMDYSYRAMHAAVATSGDRLTTGEFSTIEHQVISAVEVSDYKKVRQGTYYTLVDGRIVRKYQSESGSVEYELVDTIPENRWRPKKPEKNWLERSMDDAKEMGGKIAKEAFDFLIWDDAKTVMDPRATQQEKEIAAASLMPQGKVFKLFKAGGVMKFANKGKHTAKKVKGTENKVPSYGKKSVPVGPYREVNGFPVKVKPGAQEKHIPNTPNYKQELANGKNKSIFYGDNKTAQELLDKFAGKGTSINKNKERIDFGEPIGKYYDRKTGEYRETTKGLIHYGKDGAHIVPSRP
ncbi:T7SS effector LXG polymorphic toxin [Virgibacillus pantothenticus]|uniref:T7SS effector LXG polymorphic toxin n=4 Tax=Virgibacillus pantothenticus TaxID=1473 RepID=UPI001B39B8C2|nr:T7SS effector LXG polymorphic toxin [Virgibacillus pantothenticus]QTY14789.1 hypothetical protein KBP50_12685 [Virgibacillus pantothenticus]